MSNKNFRGGSGRYTNQKNAVQHTSAKLSADLSGGKKTINDVFEIMCKEIVPFTLKDEQGFDFSPWSAEKYQELLCSIREFGVLHPVIVRPLSGKEDEGVNYEVLAGEHRLKASKDLNLRTIPAKILNECDDEKAKSIFVVTNVINRDLTFSDKIYGWGNYYAMTEGKAQKTIESLQEAGIIPRTEVTVSRRQLSKYHKVTLLTPKLRELFEQNIIAIQTASIFCTYLTADQELIAKYKDSIKSKKDVEKIISLYNKEIHGYEFDEEGFDHIFTDFDLPQTFSTALSGAKTIIKAKLKEEDYSNAQEVLGTALDIYYAMDIDTLEATVKYENTDLKKYLKSEAFKNHFSEYITNE